MRSSSGGWLISKPARPCLRAAIDAERGQAVGICTGTPCWARRRAMHRSWRWCRPGGAGSSARNSRLREKPHDDDAGQDAQCRLTAKMVGLHLTNAMAFAFVLENRLVDKVPKMREEHHEKVFTTPWISAG